MKRIGLVGTTASVSHSSGSNAVHSLQRGVYTTFTQFHATHEIYRQETPPTSALKPSILEVLTPATIRISTFWVVTPSNLVELQQRFGATYRLYVGFEVFTEVVMKSIIFWDMTPCSPLSCTPTFRRNVSPPSSGSKNSSANHRVSRWLAELFFDPEDGRDKFH
jgi:hypothetical protein